MTMVTYDALSSNSTLREAIYFPVLSSPKISSRSNGFFISFSYIILSSTYI